MCVVVFHLYGTMHIKLFALNLSKVLGHRPHIMVYMYIYTFFMQNTMRNPNLFFFPDIPTPPMDPTQYTFQCEPSTNRQMALETAEVLNIALAEEFGNGRGFQILLANRCEAAIEKFEISRGKAFHLGCGTGFLATLLARWFNTVRKLDNFGYSLFLAKLSNVTRTKSKIGLYLPNYIR